MALTEEERTRLADVVALQPTKNSELGDRWGLESGSEVHRYLEDHLNEYYYRDENSLIRATDEAAELVDVEPGVESGTAPGDGNGTVGSGDGEGVPDVIRVPELQTRIFAVVAGPEDRSESVVSVLHKLRAEFDVDPDVDEVRKGLRSLERKGVVEVVYRTVPTFKLAVERDSITVETAE
ncbi:Uncharacterized protein AArcCO_0510 [Halalkaliarchaeum sp. AArc-CO]|uniref:DUF5797 family protein n=1 Tax=unclassified Halalkaliarchaeum TaxID=2678344 RepID=UPI00217CF02A|nr:MULTISPECIES: DUF5797 family protein [unclassified Halalkaliarchaeum]MDR5673489.1 DUF5797 family protein [Halalkaliarchaeum sp. AArc-GB]UWG49833.1 Uncharacterized protein AArcCO_0510 [Halalkaliarchaeum sp. AArc-CO]